MLKYLMKYDLKKILKLLVWFYLISVVLACITRILNIWNNIQIMNILSSIFSGLTYSAIATVLINTFIHILMRFSTSFFKDQSYLTHTLPVEKDKLILSKYLSSLIVIVASILVSLLSLFIVFSSSDFYETLKALISGGAYMFGISNGLFLLCIFIVLLGEICGAVSMAFTAIVKGYSYNHKRGLKGFLWFALYYEACQIAILGIVVICAAISGNLASLFAEQMSQRLLMMVMIVGMLAYVLSAVLFYFICKREFKKGVNVD